MILNCEVCKTNFNFPENLIKETGSKVRCSKCHHVFVAYPAAAAQKDEVAELGGVTKGLNRRVFVRPVHIR